MELIRVFLNQVQLRGFSQILIIALCLDITVCGALLLIANVLF